MFYYRTATLSATPMCCYSGLLIDVSLSISTIPLTTKQPNRLVRDMPEQALIWIQLLRFAYHSVYELWQHAKVESNEMFRKWIYIMTLAVINLKLILSHLLLNSLEISDLSVFKFFTNATQGYLKWLQIDVWSLSRLPKRNNCDCVSCSHIWICWGIGDDSTWKSRDAARCTFIEAYVNSEPIRTAATDDREVQAWFEFHRQEYISPVGIPQIVYLYAWLVTKYQCVFQLLWTCHCLYMRCSSLDQSAANWPGVWVHSFKWLNFCFKYTYCLVIRYVRFPTWQDFYWCTFTSRWK